jgi:hypothetical protein
MQGPRDGRHEAILELRPPPGPLGPAPDLLLAPWISVGAGATLQVTNAQYFIAVNTTGSTPPTVLTPTSPSDGQPLIITDRNGLSAVNPIQVKAVAPIAIDDPNSPGSFVQVVQLPSGLVTLRLKFELASNHWLLW